MRAIHIWKLCLRKCQMNKSNIDIRIMGCHRRDENISKLVSDLYLSKDAVVYDNRPSGGDAMYTARKAWLSESDEIFTHRLVLQDDVEVCENFLPIINTIVRTHPNCVISLINFIAPVNYPNYKNTPYYKVDLISGCGIIMPKYVIKPCMQWCKESTNEVLKPHDSLMISKYCREHDVTMITTIPSIIQHYDDDTLLHQTYTWKRISKNYSPTPQADWTNTSILLPR